MYKLNAKKSNSRRGELTTRKGVIQTPCFMPIATKGAIKTITADEVRELSPDVILGNTYHLMLRPGSDEIKDLGGLHRFMDWEKPILTDSGGFQVFSLAKIRKITAEGVKFNSHISGKEFFMSPEDSIKIQMNIGSDIMMVLDECVELPAERSYLEKSVDLTTVWAKRCKDFLLNQPINQSTNKPLLFGIVQGGLESDLRKKSAKDLVEIGFDGYAIGGLSVGESEQEMCSTLDFTCPELPENRPRYLMGVGYPHQIVEAVKRGIDMFDCVIPTREARHGRLYLWNDLFLESDRNILDLGEFSKEFYNTINIKNEEYKFDLKPINSNSKFPELQKYSKAYLRHLFVTEDPLAQRLSTLNNLEFYLGLMEKIRKDIQ
ncbi:tRNA guanosine(34) transglycosylase Tgt [Candidatus Kuenenbacteria bacterium]|nr:tRNA guanosine(34) transglycosylase Tgt [Candidatus Kuenenbacteria bacterium]